MLTDSLKRILGNRERKDKLNWGDKGRIHGRG